MLTAECYAPTAKGYFLRDSLRQNSLLSRLLPAAGAARMEGLQRAARGQSHRDHYPLDRRLDHDFPLDYAGRHTAAQAHGPVMAHSLPSHVWAVRVFLWRAALHH